MLKNTPWLAASHNANMLMVLPPTHTHACTFHTQNGVIFALSGFKNPFRGELREKAMEMGAKYEPDWSPKCTHLV